MRRNHAAALAAAALLCAGAAAALISATGCGGGTGGGGGGADNVTVLHPDAPPLPGETECKVVETTDIPIEGETHVATCTAVAYATNPPSGGDHWAQWAKYQKYASPVPREMYVHDLEHGAIVLLYRCADACPDVVAALSEVLASVSDPACPVPRVILAPDPLLDTPIAAAAWGATYTATCIDVASLKAFAEAHHAEAPEDECADGVDVSGADPCAATDAGADAAS